MVPTRNLFSIDMAYPEGNGSSWDFSLLFIKTS